HISLRAFAAPVASGRSSENRFKNLYKRLSKGRYTPFSGVSVCVKEQIRQRTESRHRWPCRRDKGGRPRQGGPPGGGFDAAQYLRRAGRFPRPTAAGTRGRRAGLRGVRLAAPARAGRPHGPRERRPPRFPPRGHTGPARRRVVAAALLAIAELR